MKKDIALALQGGGSHGAFTWGVLEKFFEENIFNITGICGTSAGAVNAAVAISGYEKGGNKGAIDFLNKFWERLSQETIFSPIQPTLADKIMSAGNMEFSPGYNIFTVMSNFLSPYQWNPLGINILRDILMELIDIKALQKSEMELFACATNVKTGQAKVFDLDQITSVDHILASACLPSLFKAVEIDNEFYWDGGFMGNPPLYPLIHGTKTSDIVLVQINPCNVNKVPKDADEIAHRLNEISFNSSLIAELRLIEFKNKVLAAGYNMNGELRDIRYHVILGGRTLEEFDVSSKSNTTWDFLCLLKQIGREHAENWIKENYKYVGVKTTANFSEELGQYQGKRRANVKTGIKAKTNTKTKARA